MNPAPAPTVPVTLFLPFDLGCVYRVPVNFRWRDAPHFAGDPRWGPVSPLFPSELTPPLHAPVLYRWEDLSPLRAVITWCRIDSARFVFAVEGIAVLVVRGELGLPLDRFPADVEKWEDDPKAFPALGELAARAAAAFDELARKSGLTPDLRRDGGANIPWLYTLSYSPDTSPYPAGASLATHTFRGSLIDLSWRGAHVRRPAGGDPNRDVIDAIFAACCLSWEALRVLDRLLTANLQRNVLRPHGDDELRYREAQGVRDIQFFSRYLLGSTDPLRWTIREAPLRAIEAVMTAWRVGPLQHSIEVQADLVAVQSQQIEQRQRELVAAREEEYRVKREAEEKARADRAKKQAEQLDFSLKLVGLFLAVASICSAGAGLANLWLRINPASAAWWEYVLPLVPLAVALLIVLPTAAWVRRQRQERDQEGVPRQ